MRNVLPWLFASLLVGCAPGTTASDDSSGDSTTVGEVSIDDSFGAVVQRFWSLNGGQIPYVPDLFVDTMSGHSQRVVVREEVVAGLPYDDSFGDDYWQERRMYTAAVIPFGRSLERRSTDRAFPRLLVTYALDGIPNGWRNRIYIGYTPRIDQLEIIAPNEKGTGNGGYTDFLVVRDWKAGGTPTVFKPAGGMCAACHKADQPILGMGPWSTDILTAKYLCTKNYGCDDTKPHVLEDAGLDPSLQQTLLAIAPNVFSYPYAQEVFLESHRMYGRDTYGKLTSRGASKQYSFEDPHRVPELEDPLLDRYLLEPGAPLPKINRKAVSDPNVPQAGLDACSEWKSYTADRLDTSEEHARQIFTNSCQGCHLSQNTATFSVPPLPFDGLAGYVGSDNDKRTALYLLENCIMPPRRSRSLSDPDRAALVSYLRGATSSR